MLIAIVAFAPMFASAQREGVPQVRKELRIPLLNRDLALSPVKRVQLTPEEQRAALVASVNEEVRKNKELQQCTLQELAAIVHDKAQLEERRIAADKRFKELRAKQAELEKSRNAAAKKTTPQKLTVRPVSPGVGRFTSTGDYVVKPETFGLYREAWAERDALKKVTKSLEVQRVALKREVSSLKEKLSETSTDTHASEENFRLKAQLAKSEERMGTLETQIATLEKAVAKADKAEPEINPLESEFLSAMQVIDNLAEEQEVLQAKLDALIEKETSPPVNSAVSPPVVVDTTVTEVEGFDDHDAGDVPAVASPSSSQPVSYSGSKFVSTMVLSD